MINNSPKKTTFFRVLFLLICGVTITALGQLKNLSTEYSVMQFLPDDHNLIKLSERLRSDFSLAETEPILLTIQNAEKGWLTTESIEQLRQLGSRVNKLDGVNGVLSLANFESAADEGDQVAVGGLLELTASDTWEERITQDPILFPILLSKDLSTVVMVIESEITSTRVMSIIEDVRSVAQKFFPDSILRFGGVPVIQGQVAQIINDEMKLFLLLSLLAACVSLLFVFRNITAVVIPVVGIVVSTLLTMEFMVYMGYSFNALSSTVMVLVTIIVVATSTHTLMRLYKEYQMVPGDPNHRKRWAIQSTFEALFLPNLLTALTTAVGFLTLCFSEAELMRQYGLSVAVSVMLAWVITTCLLFGFVHWTPVPTPRKWVNGNGSFLAKFLKYRDYTVAFVIFLAGVGLFMGQYTNFGGKLFNDLPQGHAIREATYHIDQNLGGLLPLDFAVTSEDETYWNDPANLAKIDELTKSWRQLPGVGSVLSVPDLIRQSQNDPNSQLPQDRSEIAEIYFMFSLGEKNPLINYMTPDGTSLRIGVRMEDISPRAMKSRIEFMAGELAAAFPDLKTEYGGIAANAHELNTYLSKSLMYGFWWALGAIAILLLVIFRSLSWVLVSALPNFLPAIAILGFLGISGIALKPAVATVFSIALGIAFDNTVYILSRLRAQRHVDLVTVKQAISDEGMSCLISSICLFCGFSIFLVSYFSISQLFGLFLLLSIAVGLFGDLIFLPAVLSFAGRYLNKGGVRG